MKLMNIERISPDLLGKKIFFLYPQLIVENEVVPELVQLDYEVYTVRDHRKLAILLRNYPSSIVFLDLDEELPEKFCERWLHEVSSDEQSKTNVGAISNVANAPWRDEKYRPFVIPHGFIVIKAPTPKDSGAKDAVKEIVAALEAVEAKGRRKYIRAAFSHDDPSVILSFPIGTHFVNGFIKDISEVGISFSFEREIELKKNKLYNNVQIRVHTTFINVNGIIFGSRMDGSSKIYVMLFSQTLTFENRAKIRRAVQQILQANLNEELERVQ